eukprot:GHVT01061083.1.p3 GENE.GHVT01061083.1~~GHVT01061083.1.p3  ORF type:complete len:101 (+),score=19.06 GHVT01061083.1:374-676(+)
MSLAEAQGRRLFCLSHSSASSCASSSSSSSSATLPLSGSCSSSSSASSPAGPPSFSLAAMSPHWPSLLSSPHSQLASLPALHATSGPSQSTLASLLGLKP